MPRLRSATDTRRSLAAGAMIGVGLMAAVDEILFHQLLGWHHFYDGGTTSLALLSDGLLHAGELLLLVAGGISLVRLRGRDALMRDFAWAALFLGLGAFQLFDGVIDHKVLRTHQIRYGVELMPYDFAWNFAALMLLAVGAGLLARARSRSHREGTIELGPAARAR